MWIHSFNSHNENNYVTNPVLGLEYKDEYNTIYTSTIIQRSKTIKKKKRRNLDANYTVIKWTMQIGIINSLESECLETLHGKKKNVFLLKT